MYIFHFFEFGRGARNCLYSIDGGVKGKPQRYKATAYDIMIPNNAHRDTNECL